MARLSQSLLAVLVALAVSASALPTAPDAAQPSGSDVSTEASAKLAHAVLQVCVLACVNKITHSNNLSPLPT